MSDIIYTYGKNLYVNLTNDCPCACSFCVRREGPALGSASDLWLGSAPGAPEVIAALEKTGLSEYPEVVFCGYGEPFCALPALLEACGYLKGRGAVVRVNTNGLGDLINGERTAPKLRGIVDCVSISLNAHNAEEYDRVCKPKYGEAAFPAILSFAADCRGYVPEVRFTVVRGSCDVEKCREVAENAGISLRVREPE
ncbi:MAG: TatD family nuclease-associated radical SAM protein [Clostridiales bacterium]|jgi:TatD family-associated radical SAM protein|nr:TatD family nuclease-associated radical SAM protein [Clostridiales bacterium]